MGLSIPFRMFQASSQTRSIDLEDLSIPFRMFLAEPLPTLRTGLSTFNSF